MQRETKTSPGDCCMKVSGIQMVLNLWQWISRRRQVPTLVRIDVTEHDIPGDGHI